MSDGKPGVLRNLKIARVALVDMGANFDRKTGDGAHIVLWKRAEPEPVAKNPSVGSVHVAVPIGGGPPPAPKRRPITPDHPDYDQYETDYEKANLDADSRRALPDSAFAAVWTDSKGKKHRKLPIHDAGHLTAARGRLNAAKIPSDVKARARARIDAATRRSSKEKSAMKEMLKRLVGLLKEDDPTKRAAGVTEFESQIEKEFPPDADDKVHKADDPMCKCESCVAMRAPMPAEIGKRFEAIEKQNALLQKALDAAEGRATAAETIAKAERHTRELGEMRSLLKSFRATPFDLKDDADVIKFMKMKAADPESFERTITLLKATDEQLAKSASFQDFGSGLDGGEGGDAYAQLEALADKLVEKGGRFAKMTAEQRLEAVMLDPKNNHLVREYREQQQ